MSATILVLEDDRVLRDLLCEVLEDEGFRVIAADSLPHMMEIADKGADLLITDLMFEFELVGLEAIKQIRRRTRAHLPVLICTAAERQVKEAAQEITSLGARVLAKPFTIDELVSAVKGAINHVPKPIEQPTVVLRQAFA